MATTAKEMVGDHDVFHDLQVVIARLKGDPTVTWKAAGLALTRLLAVAFSLLPEDQSSLRRGAEAADMSNDDMVAALEKVAAGPRGTTAEVHAFDWKTLLPILLQLIKQWFIGG